LFLFSAFTALVLLASFKLLFVDLVSKFNDALLFFVLDFLELDLLLDLPG